MFHTQGVYHTPLGGGVIARLLDNQEDANTKRCVFGKLSAGCFQRRACWHRHYSTCGDIEYGNVIYTVFKSTRVGTITIYIV